MMQPLEQILIDLMLMIQFIAALLGGFYFFKLKESYWKWFCIYLIIIFIQEYFWIKINPSISISKKEYYTFFGIPIQYVFFYWLYGFKSLKNQSLFIVCSVLYLSTYILIEGFFTDLNIVYSLNLTIGTILLALFVVLEFKKQIKTDDILKFRNNKMFYVNVGVIFFYIGTYPFFAFYDLLHQESYVKIGDAYYFYFRISLCVMYLLFAASFIWGKHRLK